MKHWRRINPYTCTACKKKRMTLVYPRAQRTMCTKCEREETRRQEEKDQQKLFETP